MEKWLGLLTETPFWVYLLFVYVSWRGIKARKPGEVTLVKLSVIPLIFTMVGLVEMQRIYGITAKNLSLWLGASFVGALVGGQLVKRNALKIDRVRGIILRPADLSALPIMLLAFACKYAFGVLQEVNREIAAQPWFMVTEILAYGLFAGIFVGKFIRYFQAYQVAPNPRRD